MGRAQILVLKRDGGAMGEVLGNQVRIAKQAVDPLHSA